MKKILTIILFVATYSIVSAQSFVGDAAIDDSIDNNPGHYFGIFKSLKQGEKPGTYVIDCDPHKTIICFTTHGNRESQNIDESSLFIYHPITKEIITELKGKVTSFSENSRGAVKAVIEK
jgi:aspartate 1-decarboxylase